jgi:hypothetical protein
MQTFLENLLHFLSDTSPHLHIFLQAFTAPLLQIIKFRFFGAFSTRRKKNVPKVFRQFAFYLLFTSQIARFQLFSLLLSGKKRSTEKHNVAMLQMQKVYLVRGF